MYMLFPLARIRENQIFLVSLIEIVFHCKFSETIDFRPNYLG